MIEVHGNDSDPEQQALVVTAAQSEHGDVIINGDNTLTFTPMNEFSGDAVIDYTIADTLNATASAQVVVTVAAKQPPVEPPKTKRSSGAVVYLLMLLMMIAISRKVRMR